MIGGKVRTAESPREGGKRVGSDQGAKGRVGTACDWWGEKGPVVGDKKEVARCERLSGCVRPQHSGESLGSGQAELTPD